MTLGFGFRSFGRTLGAPGAGGGVSLSAIMRSALNNGNGLNLDFLTDTAIVVDSGTPVNNYFARNRDLLTVTNTIKHVTGPDGNLRYQAHNLLTYSEDFSNAAWVKVNSSISASSETPPSVTSLAYTLTADGTSGSHVVRQAVSLSKSGSVRLRAKAGTNNYIQVRNDGTGYVNFDLSDGSVGNSNTLTGTVETDGDWYLLKISGIASSVTQVGINIVSSKTAVVNETNSLATTVHIAGAHFFYSPADETYVATTSAAKYGLAYDHDVSTLDSSSTNVSCGTGKRTFTVAGSTDHRTATTAWADATSYVIGDQRHVNNRSFTCTVAHTSSGSNRPSGEGNAYWKRDEKYLRISDQSAVDTRYMLGRVDYQNGTTLVVDVLRAVGSGAASSWHIIERSGILIEGQRTNLLTRSQEFDHANWTKVSATISADAVTAPDGTTTADTIAANASTNFVRAIQIATLTAATHGFSIWAKAGTTNYLHGTIEEVSVVTMRFSADLAAGTVNIFADTGYSATASIEAWADGWHRIEIVFAATAAATTVFVGPASAYNLVAATSGNSVHVWGAQLEAGAFASSYIATAGSQVTRAADDISLALSALPFSATAGTFAVEATPLALAGEICALSDGTDDERIALGAGAASHLKVTDGGVAQADIDAGTFAAGTAGKLAAAWAANDFAASLDGATAVTDASGTLPGVDTLSIGEGFDGHVRALTWLPRRATDAQLEALAA